MRLTIEEIRRRYPNPQRADAPGNSSYCVGGALVLAYLSLHGWTGCGIGFPGSYAMATAIRSLNHRIRFDEARRLALLILEANDNGHFDKAWNILDEALNYGRLEETKEAELLCV